MKKINENINMKNRELKKKGNIVDDDNFKDK